MIRKIVNSALLLAVALAVFACKRDLGDVVYKSELGAVVKEHIVPAQRGTLEIEVLAGNGWQAEFTDEYDDWAVIENSSNYRDGKLKISYMTNDYFARKAALRIWSEGRADTVYIKQQGAMTPQIELPNPNIIVSNTGGDAKARLNTNIDIEDLEFEIIYASENDDEWIEDYRYTNGMLIFGCRSNTTSTPRNARVNMSFTDGWGDEYSATLYQIQADANGKLGDPVSFADLRNISGTVTENLILEGVIVSDKNYGNAGDVEQLAEKSLDYDGAKRTAYIQSLDGEYGFRIMCKAQADNTFRMWSKVSILLKGAEVVRDNYSDVECYTINGVTANMVASSESGTKDAYHKAAKTKAMSQLTDKDIYTYVTLTDCEFPVRKGPLVPINEGYANYASQQRIGKYPLLFRDKAGDDMYLMTNTICTYRRSGEQLPYGSGSLSGVVVHERFEHMSDAADEQTYGDIGRYQLRHQTREDVYDQMEMDQKNSFSALVFEMRYVHMVDNKALATEDGMEGYVTTTSILPDAKLGTDVCFSALSKNTADWTENMAGSTRIYDIDGDGIGITLLSADGGSDFKTQIRRDTYGSMGVVHAIVPKTQTEGVTIGPALTTKYTWNYDDKSDSVDGSADGFLICFSSKNVPANKQMSLQIATFAISSSNAPRWWKVEWSETGTKDGDWQQVGIYNSTIHENWSAACVWNMNAPKISNFNLPLAMNGKNVVYLRLVPRVNSTGSYAEYNTGLPIENDTSGRSGTCALDYVGIRYNK